MNKILNFESFNEEYKFIPDLAKKSKTWYLFDTKEILKISDNVIDLIQTAYKNTSHGSFIKNSDDLLKSTDWYIIDWDEYPDADAVLFGRKTKYGIKIQGIGHNGEPKSKEILIKKLIQLLNKDGYWIEASDKVESLLYKNNTPYIKSEDILNEIFPNSNLKLTGELGKYTRILENGHLIKETVFGKPKI